ncbi:MAG: hypothetical protein AAGI30_06245 [Planctomycetota bacterium]
MHNDGGRAAAGFKGTTGDCACRAIAIATEMPYRNVYDMLIEWGRHERLTTRHPTRSHPRTGVSRPTLRKFMSHLGWVWHPTMGIGTGCRVHLRPDELPRGRLVVSVTKHITAVINGVVHDTHDPSRRGTRCVYGYWNSPLTQPVR